MLNFRARVVHELNIHIKQSTHDLNITPAILDDTKVTLHLSSVTNVLSYGQIALFTRHVHNLTRVG